MVFDYKKQYHKYKQYFAKLQEIAKEPMAKLSFALTLTFFTISFFGIFALKPTFTTITKLVKEINDNESLNRKLEEKIVNLQQAQIIYQEIQPSLVYLNEALPIDPEFNSFLGKLNYLVYSNSLVLENANFSRFTLFPSEPNLIFLKFTIDVEGSYPNINKLIEELNNLDRLVKLESIYLKAEKKSPNSPLISQINGQVFWFNNIDTN